MSGLARLGSQAILLMSSSTPQVSPHSVYVQLSKCMFHFMLLSFGALFHLIYCFFNIIFGGEGIEKVAETIDTIPKVNWDFEGIHYFDNGPLTVQYLFVLDALNFCFWPGRWYKPRLIYHSILIMDANETELNYGFLCFFSFFEHASLIPCQVYYFYFVACWFKKL